MNREQLARELSERVRALRLKRAGYSDEEIEAPSIGFDGLPKAERENWRDVAEAVLELKIQTEQQAIEALEAVLSWTEAEPASTAQGAATGYTFQRGRVIATRIKPENTIGISTYETAKDAAEKTRKIDSAYREWRRLLRQNGG